MFYKLTGIVPAIKITPYSEQGDIEESMFEKISRMFFDDRKRFYYLKKKTEEFLEKQEFPGFIPITILAYINYVECNFIEAKDYFKRAIAYEKDDRGSWQFLAFCYRQLGDDEKFERIILSSTTPDKELLKEGEMKKLWSPDTEYLKFLALKLTHSDLYPPIDVCDETDMGTIKNNWEKWVDGYKIDSKNKKIGLFVYIPFCQKKCFFCRQYSLPENQNYMADYLKRMYLEFAEMKETFSGIKFDTLYIGGGTPTVLSSEDLEKLFLEIYDNFKIKKDSQIMIEATPTTINEEKVNVLKKNGVNRMTIGIQSFDQNVLKRNNRYDKKEDVKKIIKYIQKQNFCRISTDLIAGLPGETVTGFESGLNETIAIKPDMINVYAFSPQKDTIFSKAKEEYSKLDMGRRSEMMRLAREKLSKAEGYKPLQYGGWAKDELSRNIQETDFIEHKASLLSFGHIARSHIYGFQKYMCLPKKHTDMASKKSNGFGYLGQTIDFEDEIRKYVIMNLRRGISITKFFKLFGKSPLEYFEKEFDYLKREGKIIIQGDWIVANLATRKDFLMYQKIFYKDKWIKQLKEQLKEEYEKYKGNISKIEEELDNLLDKEL